MVNKSHHGLQNRYCITNFWVVSFDNIKLDFRSTLLQGHSAIQSRKYNSLSEEFKNSGLKNKWRKKLAIYIRGIIIKNLESGYKSQSICQQYREFKLFLNFFDLQKTGENDDEIIKYLYVYTDQMVQKYLKGSMTRSYLTQRICILSNLMMPKYKINLVDNVSKIIKLHFIKTITKSQWVIKIGSSIYDFRQLLMFGMCEKRSDKFVRMPERQKVELITCKYRKLFVISTINAFKAFSINSSCQTSINLFYNCIRYIFKVLENGKSDFKNESLESNFENIVSYFNDQHASNLIYSLRRNRSLLNVSRVYGIHFKLDTSHFIKRYKSLMTIEKVDNKKDEWVFKNGSNIYDFRYVTTPKCLSMNRAEFRKLSINVKNEGINENWTELLSKFRNRLLSKNAKGISVNTIKSETFYVFKFLKYIHSNSLSIDKNSILKNLSRYSREYVANALAGNDARSTCNSAINFAVDFVSSYINQSKGEVKAVCSYAQKEKYGGQKGIFHTNEEIETFSLMINNVIGKINASTINKYKTKSLYIKVKNITLEIKIENPSLNIDIYKSTIPNNVYNMSLVKWRIYFEYIRFIAITGVNPCVAKSLYVGDFTGVSEKEIQVFKPRKKANVTIKISKQHRKKIDLHIAFMDEVIGPINENTVLFPDVIVGSHTLRISNLQMGIDFKPTLKNQKNNDKSYSHIRLKVLDAGLPWIPPSQLRKLKSNYFLNKTNGDLLVASRALSNAPSSIFGSYGGKGNLQLACKEITEFFNWDINQYYQTSHAPGKCLSNGYSQQLSESKSITCGVDTSCLFCIHYRGENSLDYIHKQLSWQHLLILRTSSNSSAELFDAIEAINQIVIAFEELNPDKLSSISKLRDNISQGLNVHSLWAKKIKVYSLGRM